MAHLRNQKPITKKPKSYSKFECDICPKTFKAERDMLDHRSAVHLNTLLYSCDFCGSRFSTNANKKVNLSLANIKRKLISYCLI
jgi:transcription elongation factor Elf1